MAYADYTFYSSNFGGKLVGSAAFPALANKADYIISYLTFGRAKTVTDETILESIKMAECAVIDELFNESQYNGRRVASESIGDKSVSYADASVNGMKHYNEIIRVYLEPTGLMYRGFSK